MSDFAFDRDVGAPPPEPRRRNANLGSADAEEIFMSFDTKILRRFFAFLKPHKWMLFTAQAAVLLSAGDAALHPLPDRPGGDRGRRARRQTPRPGADRLCRRRRLLRLHLVPGRWMSSRLAQKVIFDIRRTMFAHFQDVALTFMDKTHVGRVMSRLQGDVNAMQEFLESSTGTLGDFGHAGRHRHLPARHEREARPVDHPGAAGPDRHPGGVAALLQDHLPQGPRRLFHRQRRPGGEHQRHPHGPGDPPRGDEL